VWPTAVARVDTWVETGSEVSPFYDSLLGKVSAERSVHNSGLAVEYLRERRAGPARPTHIGQWPASATTRVVALESTITPSLTRIKP
jgi:hypothetical protein